MNNKERFLLAVLLTSDFFDLVLENYDLIFSVTFKGEKENGLLKVIRHTYDKSQEDLLGKEGIRQGCHKVLMHYKDKVFLSHISMLSDRLLRQYRREKNILSDLLKTTIADVLSNKVKEKYTSHQNFMRTSPDACMADMWEYELDIYHKDDSAFKAVSNF